MIANLLIGQTPEGKLIIESDPVSCVQYYARATEALMTGELRGKPVKEIAILRIQHGSVDMPKNMHIAPGGVNAEIKAKAKADAEAKAKK